jgi:hypothetical protein
MLGHITLTILPAERGLGSPFALGVGDMATVPWNYPNEQPRQGEEYPNNCASLWYPLLLLVIMT